MTLPKFLLISTLTTSLHFGVKIQIFCSFLNQIVRLIVPIAKLEFKQSLTSSKVFNQKVQKVKLLSLMPNANPKVSNNTP